MGFESRKVYYEKRICRTNLETYSCDSKLLRYSKFENGIVPHKYLGGDMDY